MDLPNLFAIATMTVATVAYGYTALKQSSGREALLYGASAVASALAALLFASDGLAYGRLGAFVLIGLTLLLAVVAERREAPE